MHRSKTQVLPLGFCIIGKNFESDTVVSVQKSSGFRKAALWYLKEDTRIEVVLIGCC